MLSKSLKHKLSNHPFFAKIFQHRFSPTDFHSSELLYHGFRLSDLVEETGDLKADSIRFPDFSCNWERFSKPTDVQKRKGGKKSDGCYAFSVEQSRYKNMATTCHDPILIEKPKNYAHVEVRQLLPSEDVHIEPPKGRKLKKLKEGWSRKKRLEYRQNIVYNLERLVEPKA